MIKNEKTMNQEKITQILKDESNEKLAIRNFFNNATNGFFVEVGANEPDAPESQTFHLENLGWTGILIEPIPELAERAKLVRQSSKVWQVACTSTEKIGEVEFLIPLLEEKAITGHASLRANIDEHNYKSFKKIKVQATTLTEILESENIKSIDFISIDVEGAELEVLRGIDLQKFRPKLILLEDKHLYLSKHIYLKSNHYKIVKRLNRNCWYIPNEIPNPPIDFISKFKLWKRMYLSIWFRKFQYAFRHKTLEPFLTL